MAHIVRAEPNVVNGKTRFHQIVEHNGTIYLAGQVGNPSSDFKTQSEECLAKIDRLLATAGSDKAHILSGGIMGAVRCGATIGATCSAAAAAVVNVWLTDMRNFNTFNEVWGAWVDEANAPARATVEAKLASPNLLVEVAAIAAKKA